MSSKLRHTAAILMIALLAAPAAPAAPSKPLGVVVESREAMLRATDGVPGTTVFAGDTVSTGHNGKMLVRLGTSQIEVMPDSVVNFEEVEGIAGASIIQGTVGFSSAETSTVAVRVGNVVVKPQPQRLTHGQVTVVGPLEMLVTSFRGPLDVTMGDESLTIPDGTTYRVQGDSRGPGPVGAGAEAARRAQLKAFLVAFAVVAIPLVSVITYHLLASPSSIF